MVLSGQIVGGWFTRMEKPGRGAEEQSEARVDCQYIANARKAEIARPFSFWPAMCTPKPIYIDDNQRSDHTRHHMFSTSHEYHVSIPTQFEIQITRSTTSPILVTIAHSAYHKIIFLLRSADQITIHSSRFLSSTISFRFWSISRLRLV